MASTTHKLKCHTCILPVRMKHRNGSKASAGHSRDTHASKNHGLVRRFGIEGEPDLHRFDALDNLVDAVKKELDGRKIGEGVDVERIAGTDEFRAGLVRGMIEMRSDQRHVLLTETLSAINHGKYEEALSTLERLEQVIGRRVNDIRDTIFVHMKKLDEAIALCDEDLASRPDVSTINNKAEVLIEMGRLHEAAELYDKWSYRFRNDSNMLAGRAIVMAMIGNMKKAERLALRALKLEKITILAYIALAIIVRREGDPAGAIKILNKALDIDLNENDLYIHKADILAELGEYEKAITCCQQRLIKIPGHRKIREMLDRLVLESSANAAGL